MVSQRAFDKVIGVLYNYPQSKADLEQRRDDVLHSTPKRSEGRQGGRTSDTTGLRGAKLAEINDTESARWVDCITDALQMLPEKSRQLLELRYFQKQKTDVVAYEMCVSNAWYFVLQEQVLRDVMLYATQQGLLRPVDAREIKEQRQHKKYKL